MKHYLIEYESAHWAGPPEYVIVEAESAEAAQEIAFPYMEEAMYNLYADEYESEDEDGVDYDGESFATVKDVSELTNMTPEEAAHYYSCEII